MDLEKTLWGDGRFSARTPAVRSTPAGQAADAARAATEVQDCRV